jgi:simple sugar transport system ATP-binding protein
MTTPILRLDGITKRFGKLVANDNISLHLARGEVLALLGENGAGKSTLVSILFGHYIADAGSIEAFGKRLPAGNPRAALAAGIGMVHQHFALADNLSVLENAMVGTEPLWQPFSRIAAARKRVQDTGRRFGLAIDPDARVGDLSVGERQRVEILKALYRGARILILDEPTAVLTPQESEALFGTLQQLVAEGLSIIFISHKLDEVLRVSHRIAVLRGGRLVGMRASVGTSKQELAELMVGRSLAMPARERRAAGATVLAMREACVFGAHGQRLLDSIGLEVRSGEIVAIAGVAGNGQHTLAELLSGSMRLHTGEVTVKGVTLAARPCDWIAARVARIPEDRHEVGVVGDLPVWENAVSERIGSASFSRFGLIRSRAARRFAQDLVQRFDVRLPGLDSATRALSGGNMQKLILGRALSVGGDGNGPTLVVANQPTWGLDVGAIAYVHQRLLDAAANGSAVLLISEDLDEIFALADRIGVMHQGRLSAVRPAGQWTPGTIGMAMAGVPHAQDDAREQVSHAL